MPFVLGKRTVLVRVPSRSLSTRPPPPTRPIFETSGGQSKKVRLAGTSLRPKSGAPTPAPHCRRAGRQSTGRVGREAALPHRVTSVPRILNPVCKACAMYGKRLSERVFQHRPASAFHACAMTVRLGPSPASPNAPGRFETGAWGGLRGVRVPGPSRVAERRRPPRRRCDCPPAGRGIVPRSHLAGRHRRASRTPKH
jgi:hypothetical protein